MTSEFCEEDTRREEEDRALETRQPARKRLAVKNLDDSDLQGRDSA